MKVLITGVSSFTGSHIGRAFVEAGYEVAATQTQSLASYINPLQKERLEFSKISHFFQNSAFGSDNFLKNIEDFKPDVFVNHGAAIKGYRELSFDVQKCVSQNLVNCDSSFKVLSKTVQLFLHSSSIFEEDDERGYSAMSPYGIAKAEIWKKCKSVLDIYRLPYARIVIPDPVGAFENPDRLGPVFFRNWKQNISSKIVNPLYVWDRVPAPWLAKVYVDAVSDFINSKNIKNTYRPSAFVENNRSWAYRMKDLFEENTHMTIPAFLVQGDQTGERVGVDKISFCDKNTKEFMNDYAEWLLRSVLA